MSETVQTDQTIQIPGDAVAQTALPVMAHTDRMMLQNLRYLYEKVTGGIAPGNTTQTMDGTTEYTRPHDHSGLVAGVYHGAFMPRLGYSGIGVRHLSVYAATPKPDVTAYASSGWVAQANFDINQMVSGGFAQSLEFDLAKISTFSSTSAIYISHVPVTIRRGATNVTGYITADCTKTAATPTAWATGPKVLVMLVNALGGIFATQEITPPNSGYTPTGGDANKWITDVSFTLQVNSGDPLDVDSDAFVYFALLPQDNATIDAHKFLWRGCRITESQV